MDVSANPQKAPKPDPLAVSEGFMKVLAEQCDFEEAILADLKVAYDAGNKKSVFTLVGKLIYEGPGKKPKTDNRS